MDNTPFQALGSDLLPEEKLRQNLLHLMVSRLEYPRSLIAVEKELSRLPHLQGQKLPVRRLDILVFAKNIHPLYELYPLLVIECKKDKLSQDALYQVLGYNYYIKAFFAAIAGKEGVKVGFYEPDRPQMKIIDFLPSYPRLLQLLPK